MTTVGEKLRAARKQRGLSLEDVASATRINKNFLEQFEAGIEPALPPTYARAFLRSFAEYVGVDPKDLALSAPHPEPTSAIPPAPSAPAAQDTPARAERYPATAADVQSAMQGQSVKKQPVKTLFVLLLLVSAGLALSVYWLKSERKPRQVQEISFTDLIREQEEQSGLPAEPADTTRPVPNAGAPDRASITLDSLTLIGTTTDSVWMRVVIDGVASEEYSFPPNYTMRWRAGKSFTLSIGNAGGVEFTLNGVKLGTLGLIRKPVRNLTLSRETLRKPTASEGPHHDSPR